MAKKRTYSQDQLLGAAPTPSLSQQLGSSALSCISAVANVLDLPGSMVRDTANAFATGNFSKNNPFDQLLSPMSGVNRTSGRDLNRTLGLADSRDTTANWWGGLATDITTDPFTYLTLGGSALGKFGKIAKAAGVHGDEAARIFTKAMGKAPGHFGGTATRLGLTGDMIARADPAAWARIQSVAQKTKGGFDLTQSMNEPLGGLAKFWPTGTVLGTGKGSQAFAQGMDTLGNTIRYAKVPGTNVRPVADVENLFTAQNYNATNRGQRHMARSLFWDKERARAGAKFQGNKFTRAFHEAGLGDAESDVLGNYIQYPQTAPAHLQPIVHEMRQMMIERYPDMFKEIGGKMGNAQEKMAAAGSDALFKPRALTEGIIKGGTGNAMPMSGFTRSSYARWAWTHGIVGGDEKLKEMGKFVKELRDQGITLPGDVATALEGQFGQHLNQAYLDNRTFQALQGSKKYKGNATVATAQSLLGAGKKKFRGQPVKIHDTWKHAAKSLMGLSDEVLESGVWGNYPMADIIHSSVMNADALASMHGVMGHIVESAKTNKNFFQAGEGSVPMGTLLSGNRRAGIKGLGMTVGDRHGGAAKWFYKHVTGQDLLAMKAKKAKQLIRAFRNIPVAPEEAAFLRQAFEGWGTPSTVKGMLSIYDDINKVTKALYTSAKPSFHGRNFPSGQNANFNAAQFTLGSLHTALSSGTGRPLKGAAQHPIAVEEAAKRGIQGLTDEQATKIIHEMAAAHEMTGTMGATMSTHPDHMGGSVNDILHELPDQRPFRPMESIGKLFGGQGATWNPFKAKIRGVAGAQTSTFAPVAAGEPLGAFTEHLNRFAPWYELTKQGVDPTEAARRVLEAQVGYQNRFYTKTEQDLMNRLVLFYKYCVPEDHEILTRDGWKRYTEVCEGDLVLGYDNETEELAWTPVLAMNIFEHDGELIEFSRKLNAKKMTFRFTEGHRWPIRRRVRVPVSIGGQYSRGRKTIKMTVTGSRLIGGDKLICSGDFKGDKSILSPRLAAILGWLVTDGHIQWRKNRRKCQPGQGSAHGRIYQHPKKYLAEIKQLVGHDRQYQPHPVTGVVAVPVAREDLREILKVFTSKADLPKLVGRLSRESAEAMLRAMFLAEGDEKPSTGLKFFSQDPVLNRDVLDAFQVLCILTGRTANIAKSGCTIRKRSQYQISKSQMSRVHYKGKVWCPTTATGTWVMRHDGQVVITGNSKGQVPFTLRLLTEQPGGRLAQTLRAIHESRDDEDNIPGWIKETTSIPLEGLFGPTNDGTKRYFTGLGLSFEDPMQFATPNSQQLLMEGASRLNPALKGPLEWMTGQSFFQKGGPNGGRPLEDLDPVLGRTMANIGNITGTRSSQAPIRYPFSQNVEHLLSNSPLSTMLTMARTATDPRKGLGAKSANLLTGLRITDVSPPAQDRELRQKVAQLEKGLGAKVYSDVYLPEEVRAQMSPKELAEYEHLKALRQLLVERAKARKAK